MQDPRDIPGLEIQASVVEELTRDIDSQEAREEILTKVNVVGIGVGTKFIEKEGRDTQEPCVKVLVSQKLPEGILLSPHDVVPSQIGGNRTDVVEVGELFAGGPSMVMEYPETHIAPPPSPTGLRNGDTALARSPELGVAEPREFRTAEELEVGIQLLRNRMRPAEGGYSVGHYRITAGTIATAVYDRTPFPGIPSRYYILSNNHVLANSNNCRIGDPILQPGSYDGGTYPGDVIARLSRFVPIRFNGPDNYVDAAIAEGPFHWLDREVYWIGYVKGVRGGYPAIGEILQKTGRTTNYTTGRVIAINATVNVNYGGGNVARFIRQIVTTNMSAGGDSGSLVLDLNEQAVGLLFAGSSVATIMNRIDYVQALLGVRVV